MSDKSVCWGCWNEEGDKNECIELCPRLESYQLGRPWQHIQSYIKIIAQGPEEIMEQKFHAQIEEVKMKTWQEKYDYCKNTEKCLNCGKERSATNKLQAGLCKATCNSQWRRNTIRHPIYGKFISQADIKLKCSKENKMDAARSAAKETTEMSKAGREDERMEIINIKKGESAKRFIKRMSEQQLKAELQLASKTFKKFGGIGTLEAMILMAEEIKKRNIYSYWNKK